MGRLSATLILLHFMPKAFLCADDPAKLIQVLIRGGLRYSELVFISDFANPEQTDMLTDLMNAGLPIYNFHYKGMKNSSLMMLPQLVSPLCNEDVIHNLSHKALTMFTWLENATDIKGVLDLYQQTMKKCVGSVNAGIYRPENVLIFYSVSKMLKHHPTDNIMKFHFRQNYPMMKLCLLMKMQNFIPKLLLLQELMRLRHP